jgi:A/G-specific adenine glycosylase
MDGNVERVTARLLALSADPKSSAARRRLLARAAELLDPARPGDGNQALMELGATVCTPRAPRCLLCPLREAADGSAVCAAAAEGDPERYPRPRKRRATESQRRLMLVVERPAGHAGELLLFRRPDDATLLAGTWELPWAELVDGAGPRAALALLASRYGGRWQAGEELGVVRHGITHRALEIRVHRGSVTVAAGEVAEGGGVDGDADGSCGRFEPRWFAEPDLAGLALSSMVTKALKLRRA